LGGTEEFTDLIAYFCFERDDALFEVDTVLDEVPDYIVGARYVKGEGWVGEFGEGHEGEVLDVGEEETVFEVEQREAVGGRRHRGGQDRGC
jgi:hypothetical protein